MGEPSVSNLFSASFVANTPTWLIPSTIDCSESSIEPFRDTFTCIIISSSSFEMIFAVIGEFPYLIVIYGLFYMKMQHYLPAAPK